MSIVRSIFRYDAVEIHPVGALLRTSGLVLAALGGFYFGGLGAAVLASIGALYAGIASYGGVHGARLRRMLAAAGAAAVTTFVGCLIQPSDWGTIVGVAVGTFILSMLADAGPDAAQVALLATGLLVVFSGLTGAHDNPLGNAVLVLGGGLVQAAILMGVHPLSPVAAERRAIATVYAGLARFAQDRSRDRANTPLPNVLTHALARSVMQDGLRYNKGPELTKLWSELELADALRGNLAGLERVEVRPETWLALSNWFEEAVASILRGKPIERRLPDFDPLPSAVPWLRRLRRTVEAEGKDGMPEADPTPYSWILSLKSLERLRSLALGHALRYTLAITVATASYRLLKVDHGYWAPLSLAFSLKPDFAGTLTKGVGRIFGTVCGVGLATAFVTSLDPSSTSLAVGLAVATWVAYSLLNAWYVGYSAALAFWVVDAVTLAGATATKVGVERIEATTAGSLLALATALLWPRWEAGKARTALATAFAAQAAYAEAVLAFESIEVVAAARLQSRSARLEAERVVEAAGLEPFWSRDKGLRGTVAARARLAENAARVLAAHIAALDPHEEDVSDDMRRLAEDDRDLAADLMG